MGPLNGAAPDRDETDPVLAGIERTVGWRFARPELLREALTHRSAAHEMQAQGGRRNRRPANKGQGSNERLEFIGDRVLGLLMAEWLIERFPREQEGALGPRLARLVSRPILAKIAVELGFREALSVASHEDRAGIRDAANVLADSVEAVLGAIYLDGGLDPARAFMRRAWDEVMVAQALPPKDAKTALQEWLLARGLALPVYELESSTGPSHAPHFVIRVEAAGRSATGEAGSKRAAESLAAASLLGQFQ
ncbi:ribonuclease III [Acetobacteraceae bacterium KSS8]|uniref:Ribonuclease 3 n=1 Tax=Endosaccharibacter trunci TaxID=2812733 RepID=A0ABT1W500_9PROT|nr:ribonuclease III [Acetobacteraceae bacterium KSS8]